MGKSRQQKPGAAGLAASAVKQRSRHVCVLLPSSLALLYTDPDPLAQTMALFTIMKIFAHQLIQSLQCSTNLQRPSPEVTPDPVTLAIC